MVCKQHIRAPAQVIVMNLKLFYTRVFDWLTNRKSNDPIELPVVIYRLDEVRQEVNLADLVPPGVSEEDFQLLLQVFDQQPTLLGPEENSEKRRWRVVVLDDLEK